MGRPSIPTANPPGIRASSRRALTVAAFAGVAGLALAPGLALAGDDVAPAVGTDGDQAITGVSGVEVTATHQASADSPKYTAPLVDTPQTITVIPKDVIEAQNLLTLRDILSTVPGITFGAGEGGGGYGDSINLRGYSASSDISIDGVRDSAQYSRTDPFNIQQIEVTSGADGVYNGSGSVGGNVNIVSKAPLGHDESVASVAGGTDNYARVTVDANKLIGDDIAVRLNAMAHENDAPGRDVENFKRWGIAPSVTFGINGPTRFTLSYFHQTDDNIPQYGVPFFNGAPIPGIDPSLYYGFANVDTQRINVDSLTGRFEHDLGSHGVIRNLTRYEVVSQLSIVDVPQGAFCLANGLQPVGVTQVANTAAGPGVIVTQNPTGYQPCVAPATPGFFNATGPRGNLRDTRNTEIYNQTDYTTHFNTGPVEHNMTAGASFLAETFHLDTGRIFFNANGSAFTNPLMSITAPNNTYSGPRNYFRSSQQDGSRNNEAAYLFDVAKLGQHVELNFGLRYDHVDGVNSTDTYATAAAVAPATTPTITVTPGQDFRNSDNLFSFRVGAVYKPTENSSLYIAYGNTETPSQSAVNGSCTAQTCDVDPEKARNIEAGAKWNTRDGRLALTASIFRNQRTNYKVPSGAPTLPDQVLNGSSQVDGLALSATGKVTDRWSIFANYTYLDSEVTSSASKLVASTIGDFQKGDPLTLIPKNSGSLFTTYDLPWRHIQIGYGVTYQGSYYLTQHSGLCTVALTTVAGVANQCPPGAAQVRSTLPLLESHPYWVQRLSVRWEINRKVLLQLNVNNLFNRTYYTRVRNNGWATPGDARNATLTLDYRF